MWTPTIENCNSYLNSRTGSYEQRRVRYRAAGDWLLSAGLSNTSVVYDLGAGRTEFDYCLRRDYDWRGVYVPIDGSLGTDLETWEPKEADFYVCLEIVEHLYSWRELLARLQRHAKKGIVVSTPNPSTTDVLGMDATHVTEISAADLEAFGFNVAERTFYGGVFSAGKPDSLFATWRA